MPTFCRHNRFLQNCPICSREQSVALRDVVTPAGGGSARASTPPRSNAGSGRRSASQRSGGVRVRRLARGLDDGFHSALVPGLKSSADAERLAGELAFAAHRLDRLRLDPPGLYAEVAHGREIEERTWLAFLIAYLGPLEGEDPFAGLRACRTSWASGELPQLEGVPVGPRGAHEAGRGTRTIQAYREWAHRAGSQAAAFTGEKGWSPERRFARAYERLALPGLHRDARFELLVALGALAVYDLRPDSLHLGGDNDVTVAAKRALGIGDPLLLDRRAAELADAGGLPLGALDLGLYNWGRDERATVGLAADAEPDTGLLGAVREAFGV
jgi:hypothetical protein